MSVFFNVPELFIVIILILLLDLNNFCDIVLTRPNVNIIVIIVTLTFLLFDCYFLHYTGTLKDTESVSFKVDGTLYKATQFNYTSAEKLLLVFVGTVLGYSAYCNGRSNLIVTTLLSFVSAGYFVTAKVI